MRNPKTDQEIWDLLSICLHIREVPNKGVIFVSLLSLIGAIGSSQDAFAVFAVFSMFAHCFSKETRGADFLSALTIRHIRPVVTGHSRKCPLFGNPIMRGLAEKSADLWSSSWFSNIPWKNLGNGHALLFPLFLVFLCGILGQ